MLQQPPEYDTAVSCAKLRDSTLKNNYDRLSEQIRQLKQKLAINNLNYADLVKLTQQNAKLKTRI